MIEYAENELNNIFEEKLYVSKRSSSSIPISHSFEENHENNTLNQKTKQAFGTFLSDKNGKGIVNGKLRDITNRVNTSLSLQSTGDYSSVKYPSQDLEIQNIVDNSNDFLQSTALDYKNSQQKTYNSNSLAFDGSVSSYAIQSGKLDDSTLQIDKLPKESSLEGIYDDIELKDVLITKNMIETENKRVSFKDNCENVCWIDRDDEKGVITNSSKNVQSSQNLESHNKDVGNLELLHSTDGIKNDTVVDSLINKAKKRVSDDNLIECLEGTASHPSMIQVIKNDKFSGNKFAKLTESDKVPGTFTNSTGPSTIPSLEENLNTKQIQSETLPKDPDQNANDFSIRNKKIKELEREFNLIIQTQKDVLKTKSKLYQFIYSEIMAMRKEFSDKTVQLERENMVLKDEIKDLRGKMQKMKDSVAKYNENVLEKVEEWKNNIKIQVSNYLKSREHRKET